MVHYTVGHVTTVISDPTARVMSRYIRAQPQGVVYGALL